MTREPMWRRYARLLGANRRADAEDELSFHYEMRVADYRKRGLDEAGAREAARVRLGDVAAVRQACAEQGEQYEREDRRRELLGAVRQDVKYGLRILLRAPVFTLIASLTLALGIGATTAIFSVVHRVLLAPLPYAEPERLVNIWEVSPRGDDHNVVAPGNYLDWRERSRSFERLGAYQNNHGVALTGQGEPVQLAAALVTPAALLALKPAPALGRLFNEEDAAGRGDVVLLSHGLWQQRFGGERTVLGRRLVLDGVPATVIGVLPATFEFPSAGTDVWRPLQNDAIDPGERRSHNYSVIARLRPGVPIGQAQSEMSAIARTLAAEHPQHMEGWGVNVAPMQADLTSEVRPLLLTLLAAVTVVLLITCVNLANLLLARAVSRQNEMAVRAALGAGRARIARQLLTESLLLAGVGGVLGVLLAGVLLKLLLAAAPENIPLLQQVNISGRVLAFSAVITMACAFAFGLAPTLGLAGQDRQRMLRERRGSGNLAHTRLRNVLLIAEVALSVVLLVGAGLLVRSFQALQRTDLGYSAENLVVMALDLPNARYPDNASHIDVYARLIERLRAIPGVSAAAGTAHAPAGGNTMTYSFAIEGRAATNPSGREDPEALHVVTADYFRTLGIPLLEGRVFDTRDRMGAPLTVIVNEALASKHWPNESPVGKRINFRPGAQPWMEIVGVVGDARMESPDAAPAPALFTAHAQKTSAWLTWFAVVARVQPGMDLDALRGQFQSALWELDNQLPVQRFDFVSDLYGASIARRSFAMKLVLAFAGLALALTVIGLYGLIAYTVAMQRQEFGVRLALGAQRAAVVRAVLARALRLAALGLVAGAALALLCTRFLSSLLFGVAAADPLTFVTIAAIVLLTAVAAALVPAWRAVRAGPLAALRA